MTRAEARPSGAIARAPPPVPVSLAQAPALLELYVEVDAILSEPTPDVPDAELTPSQADAWEREHRRSWIDDLDARIARLPATPGLASADELRMAAALRGLALAELHWRLRRLEGVHLGRLRRAVDARQRGMAIDPEIERAIETARRHELTIRWPGL